MSLRKIMIALFAFGSFQSAGPARADEVIVWHQLLLDTYRSMGGCPCPLSRIGALMSVSIFDAVNSIDGSYEPYLVSIEASPNASKEAAVAQAAHDVLQSSFPSMQAEYDAQLVASLTAIPDGAEKSEGMAIGQSVASQIMAAREEDGWNHYEPYVPTTGPGSWRPTWPDFLPPCSSHWGHCAPWGMTSGDQFRPPAPPALTSAEYTQNFNDVKELGKINSITRTSDEYTIAWFWANDRDGTYKPPGHLVDITIVLSQQFGLSLVENARLFALVDLAMADAGIVAWDAKYLTDTDFWRPIQGVREAANDGNPDTTPDPSWVPLGTGTPPFPGYVSGHATFGAVHSAIMRNYFGTDDVTFTCTTDDPKLQPGITTRTLHSFTEAALENGRSRVFLGVHWQIDSDLGYIAGTQLGNYIFDNYLRPAVSGVPGLESSGDGSLVVSRVWPNPARELAIVELDLPASGVLDMSIFDANGRRVFAFDATEHAAGPLAVQWDLSDSGQRGRAAAGTYFLRAALAGSRAGGGAGSSQKFAQARVVVLK